MKLRIAAALGAGLVMIAAPGAVSAHFILSHPAASLEQNQLGDPQKLGPCGGTTANAGVASGAVTPVRGGDLLKIKVKETVYHPGYYRIALAVLDPAELPGDPEDVTREGPKGPISVSGKIDPNPKAPVLADGLWLHREKAANPEFETDVRIPNIDCDGCTLQVLQFMEEHGVNKDGRFSYHHCATLKVTANPKLRIDTDWPGQAKRKRSRN
jgi:hypothetical protein